MFGSEWGVLVELSLAIVGIGLPVTLACLLISRRHQGREIRRRAQRKGSALE